MAPVIELLIGLVFLYLILSLVASAINEGIAGIFGLRAVYLEKGIASLLGKKLSPKFFEHDLIRSLGNDDARLPSGRRPSYISATTFTDTILDLIRKVPRGPRVSEEVGSLSPSAPGDKVLEEIRRKLSNEAFKDTEYPVLGEVLVMFSHEVDNLIGFRTKVESWYDETMQRVSGWYKRRTRLIVFVIGIVLVVFINADTLNIANTLWSDSTIRSAVVDQAAAFAQQGTLTTNQATQQLTALEGLKLPLGWRFGAETTDARRLPNNVAQFLIKLLGLLLTAVALTFGAPFWFDMLKKFVGLSSSGGSPQPAKSASPAETTVAAASP